MSKKEIKNEFNSQQEPTESRAVLSHLKPTQFTVGLQEVELKQTRLRNKAVTDPAKVEKYLQNNPIIVVLGPDDNIFVIDRHHLSLALLREGYQTAAIKIEHDFSACTQEKFWKNMQDLHLLYLFDENGAPKSRTDLPAKLPDMKDDIYRSLAWFVRTSGGYNKVETPYAEFQWASYFRSRIDEKLVRESFDEACKTGLDLAKDPAAKNLPGYIKSGEQKPCKTPAKARKQKTAKP